MATLFNRIILSFFLVFLFNATFAQESPFITVKGKESSNKIYLANLSISVFVVENIATTTMEMDFYNNTNSVMEGELNFPLGEGITVSRFALDVNGEMRDGVVLEKEKATQVFEAVTRKEVDPGILEMTKGNNFKARVYPIPAKGYKKIIIAYEQELKSSDKNFIYNLPLDFKHKLSHFSVHVEVVKGETKALSSDSEFINLHFQKEHESYISDYSANDIELDTHLGFIIHQPNDVSEVLTCKGNIKNEQYFYINTTPTEEYRTKPKPKTITIVWDASASSKKRNIDKELELLQNYFAWANNVEVQLISFSNTTKKARKINIENGNWAELKDALTNMVYDGGTQLGCLDFAKIKSDEILLFTDAISNFGSDKITLSSSTVFCINSSSVANLSYLKYIAETTKGFFINLNNRSTENAINALTKQNKQFIKVEYSNFDLYDIYPNRATQFNQSFSLAGKIRSHNASIKIHFGFANEITETKTYTINNENPIANNLIEKIWVQKKIAELGVFEDENKDEILAVGKKFNVVTKNTSLIVLDNIEDYVEYEIYPPKSLQKEYDKLLVKKVNERKKDQNRRLDLVYKEFKKDIDWWEKAEDYNSRIIEPRPKPIIMGNQSNNSVPESDPIPARTYSGETKTVTGILRDSDGSPVAYANITIRNATGGTSSDFDGRFSLEAPVNGILIISTVGFKSVEIDISNLINIEIVLEESSVDLDEVFVIQEGIRPTRSSIVTGNAISQTEADTYVVDYDMEIEESVFEKSNSNKYSKSSIKINTWNSNAPYMAKLKASKPAQLYKVYLSIKEDYSSTPSFYFDVASYMVQMKQKEDALRVISNLAEMELENHEILRSLGRKLSEFGFHKEAIHIFKEVLEIRSFEPQSYRDLGIAYADNNEYQKAINHLYSVIEKVWANDVSSRFEGIEVVILHEINSIILQAKATIDTTFIDDRFLVNMPVDIRIVIDWDANDTDIDLWVTDPRNEKCSYQNKNTRIGGRISNDMTEGYGPEEFLLKYAINGKYKIEANYFGSSKQSITGPVTVRAYMYTNYGSKNEKKEVVTLQIKNKGEETYHIGDLEFEIEMK